MTAEIMTKCETVCKLSDHELRDLYDARVISVWDQGDTDFELGVSMDTLNKIYAAYSLVNYVTFFEGLTDAELQEYDSDVAFDLYHENLHELLSLYRNWHTQGLTLIPCYA